MNKTVTANISGVVFHIETNAYEKLHQYLNTIRNYFIDSDGTDEIMADIEARIAELFKENLGNGKEVITQQNVQKVIEVMGEPEQYMDPDSSEEYTSGNFNYYSSKEKSNQFKSRKLYRDPDDNMLGGVCAGLGYYFGIDRIWLRALFLIAVIAGFGTGFLIYLILWIIIPSAKNTAEKLEMKGEPINVENIGNTIKDEFNGFKKKKVNEGNTSHYGKKAESAAYRFFDFLSKLFVFIFKFIGKVLGFAFVVAAVGGIITMLIMFIGGPFNMHIYNSDISNVWTTDMAEIFFSSSAMFNLGFIGLFLITMLPLLGILYGGLKLLFKIPSPSRTFTVITLSLFAMGVIMICVSATTTAAQYSSEQRMTETIPLDEFPSDTLILSSLESTYSSRNFGSSELFIEEEEIFSNDIHIDVIRAKGDQIELKLRKRSKGRNRKDAGRRAENTMMEYDVMDNDLKISPLISVPLDDKYRDQEIKVSIALPVGKTIYLTPSSREIIYDIENVTDTYDGRMIGHHWLMTKEGLRCTDCEWMEEEEIIYEEGELEIIEEEVYNDEFKKAKKDIEVVKEELEKVHEIDLEEILSYN